MLDKGYKIMKIVKSNQINHSMAARERVKKEFAEFGGTWLEFAEKFYSECVLQIPDNAHYTIIDDNDEQWSLLVWSEAELHEEYL
jgi:hypothetical protein